jgi:hypothetical protein
MLQALLEIVPELNNIMRIYTNSLKWISYMKSLRMDLGHIGKNNRLEDCIHPKAKIKKENLTRFNDKNGLVKDRLLCREV